MSELSEVIRQIERARRDLHGKMPDRIAIPAKQLSRIIGEQESLVNWDAEALGRGVRIMGVLVVPIYD